MIPVFKQHNLVESLSRLEGSVESGWVSANGPYVEEASTRLKKLVGSEHVILVNNGTAAMHLVSKAVQYKHPDIEYIVVPSITSAAAWNPCLT